MALGKGNVFVLLFSLSFIYFKICFSQRAFACHVYITQDLAPAHATAACVVRATTTTAAAGRAPTIFAAIAVRRRRAVVVVVEHRVCVHLCSSRAKALGNDRRCEIWYENTGKHT